jgi:hypothetical protein
MPRASVRALSPGFWSGQKEDHGEKHVGKNQTDKTDAQEDNPILKNLQFIGWPPDEGFHDQEGCPEKRCHKQHADGKEKDFAMRPRGELRGGHDRYQADQK